MATAKLRPLAVLLPKNIPHAPQQLAVRGCVVLFEGGYQGMAHGTSSLTPNVSIRRRLGIFAACSKHKVIGRVIYRKA